MFCFILQYGYGNYDPQQYPKQVTEEQQQEPQTSQSQKDQGAQKATKKVGYKFHWIKPVQNSVSYNTSIYSSIDIMLLRCK